MTESIQLDLGKAVRETATWAADHGMLLEQMLGIRKEIMSSLGYARAPDVVQSLERIRMGIENTLGRLNHSVDFEEEDRRWREDGAEATNG